ncbi:MAG: metal-dependent transcriptional regulator [Defluviitaleaceae bacterium]|nr:metal-dependent transcriptional regulator [Defluviitaleaceae bacterium]
MKTNNLSSSSEDYLENILHLSRKKTDVRVTDLAIEMKISKPSVNKAIINLKNLGLIEHEKYGTITLTNEGENIAKKVRDKHNILKKFLIDVLEIEEEKADKEACEIEHILSSETIEKIKLFVDRYKK